MHLKSTKNTRHPKNPRNSKTLKLEETSNMSICIKTWRHFQFTIWHCLCQNIQTEDIFVLDALILFVMLALKGLRRSQGYLWSQCLHCKSELLNDREKALKINPKVNSEPIKKHHSDIQTKHRPYCALSGNTWQEQVATVHLFWGGLQNTKLQLHTTRIWPSMVSFSKHKHNFLYSLESNFSF